MARMIPFDGPVTNDSHTAEPIIYQALANQLSDDFTIIHSLPWLSQAVKEFDGRNVPLGEIDFLILHPDLGILALEVKGGTLRAERHRLVVERTGKVIDPVSQVSRGAFALSRWLEGAGQPAFKIGYAFAFPQSDLRGRSVPPGLIDTSLGFPQSIYIDKPSLPDVGRRVVEIMRYWQQASRISPLSQERICAIVDLLCPLQDYSLRWFDRIREDNERWLVLTTQQSSYLDRFTKQQRVVLNGGNGTGKTLLAVTHSRRLAEKGQRVLFLVYNAPLADRIRRDLAGTSVTVLTFHALCRKASSGMGFPAPEERPDWFENGGPDALSAAVDARILPEYDALVLDEAQVFDREWLVLLGQWFTGKPILVCCDEKQVFSYEHRTTVKELEALMKVEAFNLTVNVRSPSAVFERLQKVLPTAYQQSSLRPKEVDALVEIAALDPLEQLHTTIRQLHAEGIPSQAIMVIHTSTDNRPVYPTDIENLVGQTVSVFRCRGLEAPIVIVLEEGGIIDDLLLACAYSRATSRCIAIYNVFKLMCESYSLNESVSSESAFRKILRKDVASVRTAIEALWPPTNAFRLTTIVNSTVRIAWSHDWGGWLIQSELERDRNWNVSMTSESIVTSLWLCHLIFVTDAPIYVLRGKSWWDFWHLYVYTTPHTLLDTFSSEFLTLEWCRVCGRWTRTRSKLDRVLRQKSTSCLDCTSTHQSYPIPALASSLSQLDTLLMTASEESLSADQSSLFLAALQSWYTLTSRQQGQICQYMQQPDNKTKMSFWACKLLVGMDLVQGSYGTQITLAERQDYYWRVCPWLGRYMGKEEWKKVVASGIAAWRNHGWLEKREKGIYLCTPPLF